MKKKVIDGTFEYIVAISYASEQKEFADELFSNLDSKGIKCFYDEMNKDKLWGASLPTFLKDVYYSKSRYCMMLISKEYISKAYPLFESDNAIARQITHGGDYILPIKFDDVEVPGLPSTIGYLRSNMSPSKICDIFLKKLK